MERIADDLGSWMAAWQAVDLPTLAESVERTVNRTSRRMRWLVVSEVLITALMLGGTAALVARTRVAPWWLAAALIHSGLVWAFTLWNRRGTWTPLGDTTRDYLALARLRSRRAARTIRFVLGAVLLEMLAVAGLLARESRLDRAAPLVAVVAATVLWVAWYRSRLARQAAEWDLAWRDLGFDEEVAR